MEDKVYLSSTNHGRLRYNITYIHFMEDFVTLNVPIFTLNPLKKVGQS